MSSQVEKNFTSANSNAKRAPPASNANSAKQNKPKLKDEETKEKESIKKTSVDNNKHQKTQDKKDNKKQEQQNDGKHEELKKVSKNDEKSQVNEKKVSQSNDDAKELAEDKRKVTKSTEKPAPKVAQNNNDTKEVTEDKRRVTKNDTEKKEKPAPKVSHNNNDTKDVTEDKRKVTKNDTEKKEKPAPPEASPNRKGVDDKKNKDVSNTNASKEVNKDNAKNKETIKAQVVEDNNVETKQNKKTDDKETEEIILTVTGEDTLQKANVSNVENGVEDHDSSNQKTMVRSSPVLKDKVKDSPAKEARKTSSSKADVVELVDLANDEDDSSSEQRKEATVSSSPKKSQEMYSSSRGRIRTDRSSPVGEEILKISPIGKRVLDKEIEPQGPFIHSEPHSYKVTLADEAKETSTDYEFATPSIIERFNSSAHRISGRRSLRSMRDTYSHTSYSERYRKITPEFETTFSSVNATCGSDGFDAPSFSLLSRAGVKRPKCDPTVESSGRLSEHDRQTKRPRLDLGGWLSIVASPVTKICGLFRKNQYDLARDDTDTKSATIEDVSAAEATEVMEIIHDEDMQEHTGAYENDTPIDNDEEQDISLIENQDDDEDDNIQDSIKEKLHEDNDAQVLASGAVSKRRSCTVM